MQVHTYTYRRACNTQDNPLKTCTERHSQTLDKSNGILKYVQVTPRKTRKRK